MFCRFRTAKTCFHLILNQQPATEVSLHAQKAVEINQGLNIIASHKQEQQ